MERVTTSINNINPKLYEYYGCSLTYDYKNGLVEIELPNEGLEVFSNTLLHHNHVTYNRYIKSKFYLRTIIKLQNAIHLDYSKDNSLFKLEQLINYLVKSKSIEVDEYSITCKNDPSIIHQIVILYLKLEELNIPYNSGGLKIILAWNPISFKPLPRLNITMNMNSIPLKYSNNGLVIKFKDITNYTENVDIITNFKEILNEVVGYTVIEFNLGYFVQLPLYKKKYSKEYVIADAIFAYKLLWKKRGLTFTYEALWNK
jgi:hypothetical protein